jgi:ATP-dependent exoDNAse (exonuclease V) beta subunit
VATTFTNKAAAELIQRIRFFLLKEGKWHEAQQIINGYVGTVNSVCGRLLKDFCFEAGLPPVLSVIPEENQSAVFERAVGPVIAEYAGRIEPVARKLGQDQWQSDVKRIIDKARTNNIDPKDLKAHSAWTWQGLKGVLPKPLPASKEKELDKDLYMAVKAASGHISPGDTTKVTKKFATEIKKILQRTSDAKDLSWYEWVRLSKISPGAKSRAAGEAVNEAASSHPNHPRFHRDLNSFISLIFECAARAMQRFADVKKSQGWIDFVDQEALLLKLLESETFSELLSERISRLFVDEFQDTSPIQLALFVKMASVVKGTIWVGDQKQAIFGFRETDPVYMDEVISQLIDRNRLDILRDNYRSHPDLLAFTNAVFESAFTTQGFSKETVRLNAKIKPGNTKTPHLAVWRSDVRNKQEEAESLAAGVRHLLDNSDTYPVLDKTTREIRPLRPADIAVLCRVNNQCMQTANSLEDLGIRASVPRTGLLEHAECVLTMAALRYLIDPSDTMARAEVVHFTTHEAGTPKWFKDAVEQTAQVLDTYPVIQKLNENRGRMLHLSPCEALNLAIEISKADQQSLKWGKPQQRLANLDALRGLARGYEDQCQASKTAGTAAGLIRHLYNLAREKKDFQASGDDEQAVQVLTYHKAKGLEWPVVILTELDAKNKASAFGISVETSNQKFDPLNPLTGRWIRYWPWPYENYRTGFGWDDALDRCRELKSGIDKETRERLRLLYVGMTRARDYMILSLRKESKSQWLDEMIDEKGEKIVSISDSDQNTITAAGKKFDATDHVFTPGEPVEKKAKESVYKVKTSGILPDYPPARFSPSAAVIENLKTEISIISIGDRLALTGSPEMDDFGNAVHRFLAADICASDKETRHQMAASILQSWGIDSFSPISLIMASDRLKDFVYRRFGKTCNWYPEWPMHLKIGMQKTTGWIDLLIKTPEGYIIIDHKTFPGGSGSFEKEAEIYAPQLAIYRQAVEKATNQIVKYCFLHLPVSGTMIEVRSKEMS